MKKIQGLGLGLGLALFLIVGSILAQETPTPEPATTEPEPQATSALGRLAAPPTVIPPSQVDDGAQLFWLWCQPCHGDRGQGLTDEWREQYPEEDQYCWNRGCHGNIPYEDGFTIPKQIPAVVGKGTLLRYQTMGDLYEYLLVKMPFEYPGALNEEEALAVTAFLAQKHGKWDGTRLTIDNVADIRLQPTPVPTATAGEKALESAMASGQSFYVGVGLLVAGLLLGLAIVGGIRIWRRKGY